MKQKIYQVIAKEWLDRPNGNRYFSMRIYKNGQEIARTRKDYGHGSHYQYEAMKIVKNDWDTETLGEFPKYPREIFSIDEKIEGCKKADVIAWGAC